MNEDIRDVQNIYCGVNENTLRKSKDRIVRLRHIVDTDPREMKMIGAEYQVKVMRNIADIRVLYYNRFS